MLRRIRNRIAEMGGDFFVLAGGDRFARTRPVEIIVGIDHGGSSAEGFRDLLDAVSLSGRAIVHNRLPFHLSSEGLYLFQSPIAADSADFTIGSGKDPTPITNTPPASWCCAAGRMRGFHDGGGRVSARGAPGRPGTAESVRTRRRRRVERLRDEHPPAAALLAFYGDVLALQQPLYERALGSRWLAAVEAADGPPRLRLASLPERRSERDFRRFVRAVPASAPDVLQALASRLASEPAAASELLRAVLAREPVDAVAARLDCDAAALEFFPRAFVQPLAEALATRVDGAAGGGAGAGGDHARAACPRCGADPLAAVLRDEPEIRGRRTLLCSLCLTEWTFPRTRCPACGEERAEKRPHHVAESWPHVRLEECGSCRTYVKAIDLREAGLAVPVVDELASVELDLWAREQGLAKLRANLLGV